MKIKTTNQLRGKEIKKRKKEQICKVKEVDEEDLYTLKINCKGKRTVGKTNKGIHVENIQQVLKN